MLIFDKKILYYNQGHLPFIELGVLMYYSGY